MACAPEVAACDCTGRDLACNPPPFGSPSAAGPMVVVGLAGGGGGGTG